MPMHLHTHHVRLHMCVHVRIHDIVFVIRMYCFGRSGGGSESESSRGNAMAVAVEAAVAIAVIALVVTVNAAGLAALLTCLTIVK